MKNWLSIILLIFSISFANAQIKNVVKWEYKIEKNGANEYQAVLSASIDKGWHMYSKDLPKNSGIPTEFKTNSPDIELIGNTVEAGKKVREFSKAFGVEIVYFSDKVDFVQKFKLKNPNALAKVSSEITYQVCDDKVCLAPNTLEFEETINAPLQGKDAIKQENASSGELLNSTELKVQSIDITHPLTTEGAVESVTESGNGLVFILGFLGGLIALLTPCVFPMIPLTVSFFTKGSENKAKGRRNAIIYGVFILGIFLSLSIPFHLLQGVSGSVFNEIATNVWLNLVFFVVFLFFALSFFGYYNITLPSWLLNKSSKAEEAGGIVGIFFMALTLVIVSFSCTGPILGSLLGGVASTSTNVPLLLTFALGGFGLAWALVFGFLALFPQVLSSLPKSGSWMNTLKVVMGFLELALALKFLSKADLVSKTLLLKREVFVAIWVVIGIALVLYLFGKIKFPYDRKDEKIGKTRKIIGGLTAVFIAYLTIGLFPTTKPNLTLLSGILPPLNVSLYSNPSDGILGLHPEHDFYKGLEIAKKENKPVLLDFTGYGCENCRKMEEFVWSKDDILPILQDDLVLVSLYVDDREELPKTEQKAVDLGNGQKKKIKTIGDKWSLFQQINFNNNSQPHYVLLTPEGQVINKPVSGYMSKDEFKTFLTIGLKYFKNK
ncbi:cytochrome c biogenesis protein CcdA [Flavobacterium aquidurense]|uniref:Thiol:disulfide interchange protein DsbD n=2 Tax=Flavobacterium TaxID=237 RepID=A0A7W7N7V3_9FLAO|nr:MULTISPECIES: thioredoxin family protein [Flavobacterium]MBB4801722.1 thiol:disulfide interchange protein DsbD [Flavobacterium nitrogenifigens]MBB6386680.1 thiol:disulfide interchange protein DsbD [Flavobacterium notoginsengisoli]